MKQLLNLKMKGRLRKGIAALLAFCAFMGFKAPVSAGEITIGDKSDKQVELSHSSDPRLQRLNRRLNQSKDDNKLKINFSPDDWVNFVCGIFTQYGVHEAGHYFGGEAVGAGVNFRGGGKWNFSGEPSESDKRAVYASGFALPYIVSEALLDSPRVQKDDPYAMGVILGPALHNLAYIVQDATGIGGGRGNDFAGMSRAGLGREVTYPILMGLAAYQTHRLFKELRSNKKSKKSMKSSFWVSPEKGGLMAGWTYRFK